MPETTTTWFIKGREFVHCKEGEPHIAVAPDDRSDQVTRSGTNLGPQERTSSITQSLTHAPPRSRRDRPA